MVRAVTSGSGASKGPRTWTAPPRGNATRRRGYAIRHPEGSQSPTPGSRRRPGPETDERRRTRLRRRAAQRAQPVRGERPDAILGRRSGVANVCRPGAVVVSDPHADLCGHPAAIDQRLAFGSRRACRRCAEAWAHLGFRHRRGLSAQVPSPYDRGLRGPNVGGVVMFWWVLLGIVVVLGAVVAWQQRRGHSRRGLDYHAESPSAEHEKFQRGTDGRAGS